MPTFRQLFIGGSSGMDLERKGLRGAQTCRARAGHQGPTGRSRPESRLLPQAADLVYKGHADRPQLKAFYLDLQDERMENALGVVPPVSP